MAGRAPHDGAHVDRIAGTITLPDSKNNHGRVLPLDIGALADVMKRREQARLITRDDQVLVSDLIFQPPRPPDRRHPQGVGERVHRGRLFHVETAADGDKVKIPDKLFHDFRRSAVRDLVRARLIRPSHARSAQRLKHRAENEERLPRETDADARS